MAKTQTLDLELKKAFMELHAKTAESSKKIQVIDSQIGYLKRFLQHVDITQREVSTLSPGTRTYESVGRMFVLTDLEDVKKNLDNKKNDLSTRSKKLEDTKQYLEKELKEFEDGIREKVKGKRDEQRKEQS